MAWLRSYLSRKVPEAGLASMVRVSPSKSWIHGVKRMNSQRSIILAGAQ